MINIFDLERRNDIRFEIQQLDMFIRDNLIQFQVKPECNSNDYLDLYHLIDKFIIDWPHRGTSLSIYQYFSSIISLVNNDATFINLSNGTYFNANKNDELSLYLIYIEFMMNQIIFFSTSESPIKISKNSTKIIMTIINNFDNILEMNNYTKKYIESENKIIIVKRDYQLDAAIKALPKDQEDLALDLLSFLDHRNNNNAKEKTRIIAELYKYFEQIEYTYKDSISHKENKQTKNIDLLDDFNFICNNFNMRHWPHKLISVYGSTKISDDEMLELLDICYYLGLQLIISRNIVNNHETVNKYKEKYNFNK